MLRRIQLQYSSIYQSPTSRNLCSGRHLSRPRNLVVHSTSPVDEQWLKMASNRQWRWAENQCWGLNVINTCSAGGLPNVLASTWCCKYYNTQSSVKDQELLKINDYIYSIARIFRGLKFLRIRRFLLNKIFHDFNVWGYAQEYLYYSAQYDIALCINCNVTVS